MKFNLASDPRRGGRESVEARKRWRWRLQPTLLVLEDRRLLSTFPVTNNAVDDVNTTGTLRWAIAQANAATSPSSIEIELGSTLATITLAGTQLDLSNTSHPTTIYDGPGEGPVSISGNNASRVFLVDSGVTASISGMTITGGSASNGGGLYNLGAATLTNCLVNGNSAGNNGGGVDSTGGGTATLTNCLVNGNSAGNNGGGVFSDGAATTLTDCPFNFNSAGNNGGGVDSTGGGTATLTDCVFSLNTASFGNGGGVFSDGAMTTLTNCFVNSNTASFGFGGGMFSDGAMTTLTNCFVDGNTASFAFGGGMYNHGTATLTNCTVDGNTASFGNGGGMYNRGTATLTDCMVFGNSASSGNGGGMFNQGLATLTGCTVSGNSASNGFGGGMYNRGTATLTNCTVSGNSASNGFGGGLFNQGMATLTDCTISGNSGFEGGGLYNQGMATLGNTIVAGNTAPYGGPDVQGTVASEGYNLIGETDGSTGWVSTDLTPTGASPLNPLLAPLANNGGPTQTMALLPGSPAIDAGNNSLIPSGVTTDQRGFDRIVNGTVDIGAFEFGALPSESIYILDATAGGALSLSGNATINVSGSVVVDSSSSSAIKASGNAQVTAAAVLVAGGVSRSGNASVTKTGPPGSTGDPLAGLIAPTYSGTPVSEVLSGNSSATISQGVYSQITVSGNAHMIMNTGVYVIAGGGFSVSGNASVSGSGVTIYNTKNSGGTYGSIVLTGNGTLTPATSGQYAGVVIFQDRSNPKAITLSGNVMQGMGGTIYAADAQLVASGNSQIGSASHPVSIVVDTMTLSGNAIANTIGLSAPTGSVAYTPAQIRAAYGVNDLSLDGTGQTIAIVDAYDDPSIFLALDAFDSQFGLTSFGPTLYQQYGPASSFLTVLNQNGQATSLPATDPSGAGTDNWEVEEALDVEWAHAIAPGAQIVLVEANSQSLSDLMSGVATAAAQPGVSVVSMSWGFAEGQQVFAADEAMYDSDFQVPGVTFVASTGDYGAADPEYPAYSPNVVSVGGTSLTLNGDNSYNSETGWGYQSASVGAFIGSGGGISQYEPEPAFQQGVQSTGFRTTPDVSLVADPATGAWIADTYNLDPSNPFEVVGGTSLSAPAWAGLLALVNQGSAAAGGSALNSSSPTEAQQALYSLPQNDYNVIETGTNGYTAGAGYNLVTGLGTPVANLVVSDLVAYQSGTFVASGPTVGALSSANLVNTGAAGSGTTNVFAVFDSLLDMGNGLGSGQNTVANMAMTTTPAAASQAPSTGFLVQGGHGAGLGAATNPGRFGVMPNSPNEVTVIPVTTGLASRQLAGPMARRGENTTATKSEHFALFPRIEPSSALGIIPIRP